MFSQPFHSIGLASMHGPPPTPLQDNQLFPFGQPKLGYPFNVTNSVSVQPPFEKL